MTPICKDVVPLLGPLLDGALPADDRAWVEDHLRGCSSCPDRLALIAAQGVALREAVIARAAAVRFDGLADRVLARVRQDGNRPLLERAGVWGNEMWAAHRGAFTAAAGLAVAACLALAVFVVPPRSAATGDGQLLAQADATAVEQVDFGTHDGAVLQLPGDTTVIWMSEDKAVPQ